MARQLVGALADDDAAVREQAAEALGHMGGTTQAIDGLITDLGDKAAAVRLAAVSALGEIGPAAARAGNALAVLMTDPDARVRRAAATALGKVGATSPDVLAALSGALRSKDDSTLRERAAHALGQPQHAQAALAILMAALDDPDAVVRREIVHALAAMPREHAAHTEPAFRRVLGSESEASVRVEAVHGLVALGAAGVPGLRCALGDKDVLVRWWAIVHLRQLGGASREAIADLERVASGDQRPWVRETAQRALEAIRTAAP